MLTNTSSSSVNIYFLNQLLPKECKEDRRDSENFIFMGYKYEKFIYEKEF